MTHYVTELIGKTITETRQIKSYTIVNDYTINDFATLGKDQYIIQTNYNLHGFCDSFIFKANEIEDLLSGKTVELTSTLSYNLK